MLVQVHSKLSEYHDLYPPMRFLPHWHTPAAVDDWADDSN